jgi:hypothetical protein
MIQEIKCAFERKAKVIVLRSFRKPHLKVTLITNYYTKIGSGSWLNTIDLQRLCRLKAEPDRALYLITTILKLVAGAGFEPTTFGL